MKSVFTILISILATGSLFSQRFVCEKVGDRHPELASQFTNAEIVKIPLQDMADYVKKKSHNTPFTLVLNGKEFSYTLYENDILRPETRIFTSHNGRYENIRFDTTCRVYVGYQSHEAIPARFTITERNFYALLPQRDEPLFIEPARHFISTAEKEHFVVYKNSDVIVAPATCSIPNKSAPHEKTLAPSDDHIRSSQRSHDCLEIEISFATDNGVWSQFGTEEEVLDWIATVQNHTEHHYLNDFDIDFWIREYFMVTNGSDPWGPATEVDDLIPDFGDWAYNAFVTEDMGHLLTTSDLHRDDDYGVAGSASVGGACDDIGLYPWAVMEYNPNNTLSWHAYLTSHEYGHLLDADHEEGTGTIMEPNIGAIECSCWAAANIEEMWDFIEDESCIETCVQCPSSYTIIDRIGYGDWKYSSQTRTSSRSYIYHQADVIMQSEGDVRLLPGFHATSLNDPSGGATLIARIATCE